MRLEKKAGMALIFKAIIGSTFCMAMSADPTDPEPPGPDCNENLDPQLCQQQWCSSFNTGCLHFIEDIDFNDPIPTFNLKAFNDCIATLNANHTACASKICPWWYASHAPTNPTFQDCEILWLLDQSACLAATHFCGSSYEDDIHPGARDALRLNCLKQANELFSNCYKWAVPSPFYQNASIIESGVIGNSVYSNNVFSPSSDSDSFDILWIPVQGAGESIDSIEIIFAVHGIEDTKRVMFGPYEAGDDGMYEISISLESIEQDTSVSFLGALMYWRDDDGQIIWAKPMAFSIAESGIPGDFDRDGERTANDIAAFLDAYENNAPRADRNGDRVVDAEDLALFLAEYDSE